MSKKRKITEIKLNNHAKELKCKYLRTYTLTINNYMIQWSYIKRWGKWRCRLGMVQR